MRTAISVLLVLLLTPALQAQQPVAPSIDQIIDLRRPGAVALSPDGTRVAFTVGETNWDDNAYKTEIFLADAKGGRPIQLTRAKKSSSAPVWSPDGTWLAFTSDRTDKRQIYLISPAGGEARALTNVDEGVGAFRWSPDGTKIAFTMTDPKSDAAKERDKKYGEFEIIDTEYRMSHLHVIDVDPSSSAPAKPSRVTSGAFTVGGFDWSPDGKSIAFDHRIDPNLNNSHSADISIVTLAGGAVRKLVTADGPDSGPVWSPDGTRIAFSSSMSSPAFFYTNNRIAVVPAGGGALKSISDAFDEQPGMIDWSPAGILFSGLERASSRLYRLNADTGAITPLTPASGASTGSFSFSRDFATMAFVSGDAKAFPEVFVAPVSKPAAATKLTSLGDQIKGWAVGSRAVISWKSTDGTEIEGVLHKPADFQPGRKYPLLVIIHGGPTGISRPYRVAGGGPYPIEQFLAKGAIILEPNYRGSAGYGEKFRALNVRNLGVGDAWDVLSGVDHLVAQGLADPARMGVMGWSQGGYISAFLATHERQPFKAISVGAGISNWMTYYVNTDIHPFTRQYLKATPWDDPDIYALTSPMTTIKRAKTPTLIQHGEFDTRVPTPNAYELYQGLQDVGVPVKLIIYKGFGHGLNKPKAARAAMEHNLEWFGKYVFGEAETTVGAAPAVLPGIETFLADVPDALRGKRVGLITNHTGIDRFKTSDIDLIARHKDLELVALLAPEHGIRGTLEAGDTVKDEIDTKTGIPVYSLYLSEDRGPTDEMLKNVDVLIYDLQEVGGRTWTYVSTMALSMEAARRKGIPFVVLDRPNPIGGEIVEGALLDPKFKSFVGMYPIPARHGMTVGELAKLFNEQHGIGANLIIAKVANWKRSQWQDQTGLPWVNPSPNLRSLAALTSYPGSVYFEGTTLSEGRGTDRPFEQIGAPWLRAEEVANVMNARRLPGVEFEAITMSVLPTAAKHKGLTIPAIRFRVTDREAYRPVRTSLLLIDEIRRRHPADFAWTATIDRLTGSDKVRLAIEAGRLGPLLDEWDREAAEFREGRKPYLLY